MHILINRDTLLKASHVFFLLPASQRIVFEYQVKFDRYSMLRSHIFPIREIPAG